MSDTSTTTETKKATRAGNYFISNYPPFSFWSEEQGNKVLEAFEQPPVPGTLRSKVGPGGSLQKVVDSKVKKKEALDVPFFFSTSSWVRPSDF